MDFDVLMRDGYVITENLLIAAAACAGIKAEGLAHLGYPTFPPFMGMVDGMHPLRLLEQS